MNRFLLIFATLSLLLAACGDDDGGCPVGQAKTTDGTCVPAACFDDPSKCEDGGMSVCDTCSADQHCDLANAKCVACLEDNHCGTDKPKCDTESGECVVCKTDGDCDASAPYCVGETNVCSVCRTNADCNDVATPRCDKQAGMCKPECETDSDCMSNAKGAFCNLATSTCVACLPNPENPDAEETACPGTSCNPQTFTCTATPKRSVGNCKSCVADRDCREGHRCVNLNYMDEPQGGYCLRVDDGNCQSPTRIQFRGQTSTTGKEADFCGFNQSLATCEALLRVGTECGDGCPESGMCVNKGSDLCTVTCNNNQNCPKDYICAESNLCELEAS